MSPLILVEELPLGVGEQQASVLLYRCFCIEDSFDEPGMSPG